MTPEEKSERLADAIVSPFPEGITDEQIIWQVIDRGLLPEVAKHMSDRLLYETWWIRNCEEIRRRKELDDQLKEIMERYARSV